jgi:hypothetical protein
VPVHQFEHVGEEDARAREQIIRAPAREQRQHEVGELLSLDARNLSQGSVDVHGQRAEEHQQMFFAGANCFEHLGVTELSAQAQTGTLCDSGWPSTTVKEDYILLAPLDHATGFYLCKAPARRLR